MSALRHLESLILILDHTLADYEATASFVGNLQHLKEFRYGVVKIGDERRTQTQITSEGKKLNQLLQSSLATLEILDIPADSAPFSLNTEWELPNLHHLRLHGRGPSTPIVFLDIFPSLPQLRDLRLLVQGSTFMPTDVATIQPSGKALLGRLRSLFLQQWEPDEPIFSVISDTIQELTLYDPKFPMPEASTEEYSPLRTCTHIAKILPSDSFSMLRILRMTITEDDEGPISRKFSDQLARCLPILVELTIGTKTSLSLASASTAIVSSYHNHSA